MNPSPADTAQWWNDRDLDHYQDHGDEIGAATVADYDRSARQTIRLGKAFTYRDPDSDNVHAGYFTLGNGRFTAMNLSRTRILTHFVPTGGEQYVLTLPETTYSR